MIFKKLTNDIAIVQSETEDIILSSVQSALDLIGNSWGVDGCSKLIIMKEAISEEFFDLSTKLLGEITQKFVNYNTAVAIVGDFDCYASKSLKDFIYESNKGKTLYFANSIEDAVIKLT